LFSLHKISVSVFFIFLLYSASGADPYSFQTGAAESGMNYSCVMKPDFWSSFHNQALLPFNSGISFGVNYLNRFCIPELGNRTLGLTLVKERAGIGAFYNHFGNKDFSRHSAGLGCGLRLSEKISLGVQADFYYVRTNSEYNNRGILTFESGMLIKPTDKVVIGLHVFNPLPNSIRKSSLPSSLRVGAGIILNKGLFIGCEADMSTAGFLVLKTGFEFEAATRIIIRGGFSSENYSFSLGTGYVIKKLRIDVGFVSHQYLGISSSASLIFNLKNK